MELLDYIQNYFNDKSERAILINGKWGSGKTYYVKTFVQPKLLEIKI